MDRGGGLLFTMSSSTPFEFTTLRVLICEENSKYITNINTKTDRWARNKRKYGTHGGRTGTCRTWSHCLKAEDTIRIHMAWKDHSHITLGNSVLERGMKNLYCIPFVIRKGH